jgi:exosortase A
VSATLALEAPRAIASVWRRPLAALGLVWLALLALLWRDAYHLVSIWWNSSTFNHCLLVGPIIVWLVAQRIPELRRLSPVPWAPGIIGVAFGGLVWLVGEAGGLAVARHAGLVLMMQGAVVALLGKAVARGLLFPLFYALFLIPVGEQLVPPLQTVTAHLATFLLGVAGIPAHLEGVFITTPSGYFEVAEACAGVKFLIAMVAFGTLVANVCFRSWRRRIVFLAACAIVPVFANGVRAWGTMLIAHHAGIEFAAGFDHVVYGGVFFALVIALMLAGAWRFFDRGVDDPWLPGVESDAPSRLSLGVVVALALTAAAAPVTWTRSVAAAGAVPLPTRPSLPEMAGWTRVVAGADWQPRFSGADRLIAGRYRDVRGREVDLVVAVYSRQAEGRELVAGGQGEAPGWAWIDDMVDSPDGGQARRIASHGRVREVWSFYRVGNRLTGSETGAKLETIRTRLLGGPQRAVAVLVSAPAPAAGASARPALEDFVRALGSVADIADRAAGTS